MTWDKLTKLIRQGHGQGHREHYKPWLHITRRTSSPVSNIGLLPAPEFNREHHYLSVEEKSTILILKWLGASDIREQYPIWPWEHTSPKYGLNSEGKPEKLPGLLSIASSIGIKHGTFLGTKIPYVATLDILGSWKQSNEQYEIIAHECKPLAKLTAPEKSRVRERLTLSGEYCKIAGIKRFIVHAELFPPYLAVNLDSIEPRIGFEERRQTKESAAYKHLVEETWKYRESKSPAEIINNLSRKKGFSKVKLIHAFHYAMWNQDIEHDLSKPLELYEMLSPGGPELKAKMLRQLFGDE